MQDCVTLDIKFCVRAASTSSEIASQRIARVLDWMLILVIFGITGLWNRGDGVGVVSLVEIVSWRIILFMGGSKWMVDDYSN